MGKIRVFFLALCAVTLDAAAANCSFSNGYKQTTISFFIPATLSIPRDALTGTTIYEAAAKTMGDVGRYKCTSAFKMGVTNNIGPQTTSSLFPIGDTGIAWQWVYNEAATTGYGTGTGTPNEYIFTNSSHTVRLVKIGDIINGAKVSSGILGYLQRGEISPLAMSTSGMTITAQSCATPDVAVNMGEHDLSTFSKNGSYSRTTNFDIKLNNCPAGINKVMYSLAPNPMAPAWNNELGIIELNKASTAKGIALQVMDHNNQPIEFNKKYAFTNYSVAGGNFSIPLAARYFRTVRTGGKGALDPGINAGTANTEISFVMSYL
ncbi:fimbrial protein [Pseudomonas salmasensis]|uniref:Fimbrial protein n=1 Tax=Pseudomonas salmasensis TaxID=2745514 RepID=A0ABU5FDD8_9PSED|nr:fimbrial protein [Pseudomonas salmasensis]MDY4299021.1 fimbrial protein [Pseudomonas salmasensis]